MGREHRILATIALEDALLDTRRSIHAHGRNHHRHARGMRPCCSSKTGDGEITFAFSRHATRTWPGVTWDHAKGVRFNQVSSGPSRATTTNGPRSPSPSDRATRAGALGQTNLFEQSPDEVRVLVERQRQLGLRSGQALESLEEVDIVSVRHRSSPRHSWVVQGVSTRADERRCRAPPRSHRARSTETRCDTSAARLSSIPRRLSDS
jgi:hypothetical protein